MAGDYKTTFRSNIHTGVALRVMVINLTAITTGFWIREEKDWSQVGV